MKEVIILFVGTLGMFTTPTISFSSPCPEVRAIERTIVHTRAKFPACAESPVPASLSNVQSHTPNRDFVVATATIMTVTLCCHNSALSCFIINETFDMLQQQETLYFGYTNFGSYVSFQIVKSNRSCRQGHTCELTLLHLFLPGMDRLSFTPGDAIDRRHKREWKCITWCPRESVSFWHSHCLLNNFQFMLPIRLIVFIPFLRTVWGEPKRNWYGICWAAGKRKKKTGSTNRKRIVFDAGRDLQGMHKKDENIKKGKHGDGCCDGETVIIV